MRSQGTVPEIRAFHFSFCAFGAACREAVERDPRCRCRAEEAHHDFAGEYDPRSACCAKAAASASGREVKLNYATQVETAPPTIAVFGNNPDLVQEHYIRYLHNGFREAWGFTGNPLRIVLRRKSA